MATCKGCNAPIRWEETRNGKRTPVDAAGETEGTSHWKTCPQVAQFRKPKPAKVEAQ
jgi:hypothetical protein